MERKVEVRRSSIHGSGVFALTDIAAGEFIIEYIGERISKEESERRSDEYLRKHKDDPDHGAVYIFELDDFDLDGGGEGNDAKYINHSCDPNAEALDEDGRVMIYALRDIKAGEEVTYNYGYSIDQENHPCRCGSEKCVGVILREEDWEKLEKKE